MATPEGPSFLTSAPVVPPDLEGKRSIVVPVSASPYRSPGEIPQPKPVPIESARRRKQPPREEPRYVEPVGDRAGEHLVMARGKYSAWFYVVCAFFLEIFLLGAVPIYVLGDVLHLGELGRGIGIVIGLVGAVWMFHDRWRCIEAASSRFCSGIMNLSLLYVPFVALAYANARGLAKLRR